jgi:CoA:oxalate CoA-transferase
VPCFPVQTPAEVVASPHYRARGAFVDQQHPVAGTVTQPGPFVRLSRTPWRLRRPAPLLGEHNEEVLCGLLGFSGAELPELAGLAPPAAV